MCRYIKRNKSSHVATPPNITDVVKPGCLEDTTCDLRWMYWLFRSLNNKLFINEYWSTIVSSPVNMIHLFQCLDT